MILLISLLIFLLILLYYLFKSIIWICKDEARIKWTLLVMGILISTKIIDIVFFTKMEFIKSKVYPNLYLVKNPIGNRDSLNLIIKNMVIKQINSEFIGNENKYISKHQYISKFPEKKDLDYSLKFYEYYKGWGSNPFGEAGTEHFIEHEEDPGGFSSELLDYYEKYKIVTLNSQFCQNDTTNYFVTLHYFKNGEELKTDTIINQCTRK